MTNDKAASLAAVQAGPDVLELYRFVTKDLEKSQRLLVQRRFKEAILKTGPLCGLPRSMQALLPLFAILPDDEIDTFSPRLEHRPSFRKDRET